MKLDSQWFDRIRVSRGRAARPEPQQPGCDHPGCRELGVHKAPKGRDRENEYWRFCLDHVRAYNQNYNFFSGMTDDAVMAYQKASQTGHRPTWAMGQNGAAATPEARAKAAPGRKSSRKGWASDPDFEDMFHVFGEGGARRAAEEPQRELKNVERKSLEALNLGASAKADEIKARYKELVKRLHPDANGGDRSTEDKLREIIQAYNYLRSAGFC
jgi:hypothetical protein